MRAIRANEHHKTPKLKGAKTVMASLFNQNKMRQNNAKTGLGMIMVKHSWVVMLLLGGSIACTSQNAGNSTSTLFARSQTAPTTPVRQSLTEPAKTTTIQVKGTPQTVALSSVQAPSFSTDFPTDRFAQIEQDAGSPVKDLVGFYWKKPDGTLNKNAYIALVLHDKDVTLRDMREELEAQVRLNEETGVQRINRGSDLSYAKAYSSWLRDVVRLELGSKESGNVANSKNDAVTTIYLGEVGGRVFFVMSVYPRQDEEEFTSRADVILKNLKFQSKKQS